MEDSKPPIHTDVPIPTSLDWEKHIPINAIRKMNRLSPKKVKFLQDKVNRMAIHLDLKETVQYAIEEIEADVAAKSDDSSSVASNASRRTGNHSTIPVIVETLDEEVDIDELLSDF